MYAVCVYNYMLHYFRHHNKLLDLNSLFRYTNLPQNAKMEMVPTEKPRTESMFGSVMVVTCTCHCMPTEGTEVTLAVQCEDGQRVQGKFDPSMTSLWGVLTKLGLCEFEGGRLEPVVAYTNNQVMLSDKIECVHPLFKNHNIC